MQRTAESVLMGLLILQSTALISGCGDHRTSPSPSALTSETIKNATYRLKFFSDLGAVKLTDGKFAHKIPGTGMQESVRFQSGLETFADLNCDGAKDAVAILAVSGGGSGTFYRLVVLINQNGKPRHVATAELGDRVQIRSVYIESGRIHVNMLTQGPNDGLCCPTVPTIRRYRLDGRRLIKLSNDG